MFIDLHMANAFCNNKNLMFKSLVPRYFNKKAKTVKGDCVN